MSTPILTQLFERQAVTLTDDSSLHEAGRRSDNRASRRRHGDGGRSA